MQALYGVGRPPTLSPGLTRAVVRVSRARSHDTPGPLWECPLGVGGPVARAPAIEYIQKGEDRTVGTAVYEYVHTAFVKVGEGAAPKLAGA